ncbi:hypothetical protein D6C89_07598 [Aureobasidium pullulans]|nr:hypothetical protein D6C89_07598 [Aureobasidium pullulans]
MTSPLCASFLSPTRSCKPFDAAANGYCRGKGVATVVLKRLSAAIANGDTVFATIPEQITVVEAHGTGTPVGNPIEYNSVREVLGSDKRTSNIALSSVKGLIGHLECTSGVVSLIKIIMMMLKGLPSDHITIPTNLLPWPTVPKAALINNYGASSSNASIVVKESSTPNSLQDISFNLLREFNPTLPERLIVTASSISGLDIRLRNFKQDMAYDEHTYASRPVILCFGRQSSTFSSLLRKHLKICDLACNSLGVGSIFPHIFQRSSLHDLTKLHSWTDCRVVPTAMVGHSFGELTALCASGSLSLQDCLKAIIGRVKVIESS